MGVKCIEFLPNKSKKAIASRAHICNLHVKKRKKYKYIVHCHDKWEVRINVNGKILYFGSYSTKEEAGKVAKEKALEYGNPWDDLLQTVTKKILIKSLKKLLTSSQSYDKIQTVQRELIKNLITNKVKH